MKITKTILILAAAFLLFYPVSSNADSIYTFYQLTDNNSEDLSGQLSVAVAAAGANQASFTFYNNVGIESSITDVYFDDGTLLGIASITSSSGVSFTSPANPGNLPSGNTASPPFVATNNFSADSTTPIMENGVNTAAEWLTITFTLIDSNTVANVIAALNDGTLRIGLHVQNIGEEGGSDSYINKVPEPGILILLGIAMSAVGIVSRFVRKI